MKQSQQNERQASRKQDQKHSERERLRRGRQLKPQAEQGSEAEDEEATRKLHFEEMGYYEPELYGTELSPHSLTDDAFEGSHEALEGSREAGEAVDPEDLGREFLREAAQNAGQDRLGASDADWPRQNPDGKSTVPTAADPLPVDAESHYSEDETERELRRINRRKQHPPKHQP